MRTLALLLLLTGCGPSLTRTVESLTMSGDYDNALDVVLEQGHCADIEVLPNEYMQSVDRDFLSLKRLRKPP